ncbi:MAG: LacI family DNA-binding transcriptional regulator [Saprospiraceae bacterium]|nr:LacI family DNA-binding transcriptional regulator [Saprospiraceae bacterium]
MNRATIKDIALRLGINISTVSRALKNHPDISIEMKRNVLYMAQQLNYIPNHNAIHLRSKESKIIALIIPSISMFFFPSVVQGIQDVVYSNGFRLLVLQSNDLLQREIENIDICLQNDVDGFLLSVSSDTANNHHLKKIQSLEVPLVLFDKVIDDDSIPQVIIDDPQVACEATEYMIQMGKRNIIGLFGNPNLNITKRRVDGFENALLKHKIHKRPDAIQYATSTNDAFRIVSTLCAQPNAPDGIFAMSDEILAGIVPALKSRNINIPTDCAVIAISDGYLPTYLDPPIPFIRHSGYEVGRKSAEILCSLIRHEQPLPEPRTMIKTQLQVQIL